MLSKENRLNLKTDFKWVASGKRQETRFLKLFLRLGQNSKPRVGIATSSKVLRKAHERNRVRRVVSAAFEAIIILLPYNINIVVLPKANALEVKSGEILEDMKESLKEVINEKNDTISN